MHRQYLCWKLSGCDYIRLHLLCVFHVTWSKFFSHAAILYHFCLRHSPFGCCEATHSSFGAEGQGCRNAIARSVIQIIMATLFHKSCNKTETHTHTCSEQSSRILMWNASYVQKQSSYTWQEKVEDQIREGSRRKYFKATARCNISIWTKSLPPWHQVWIENCLKKTTCRFLAWPDAINEKLQNWDWNCRYAGLIRPSIPWLW